ncbi:MAG: MFS transporter, partial [Devosiaceae bacterium]|nr:MFS transporter [Devosiaceae bacterium]
MRLAFFTSDNPEKAFHYAGYRYFWFAVLATSFSAQIMAVAVAWQVYDTTGNPLYLGLIGLAQFLPSLLLVLVTGWVSDRFSRRGVMAVSVLVEVGCAAALLWFAITGFSDVGPIFIVLVLLGISRAFLGPARASLAPNLVPQKALGNAIAVNATAWQAAGVIGPAAGGLLYGVFPEAAYGVALALAILSLVLIFAIPKPAQRRADSNTSRTKLFAGFRYVWHQKVVLGAISLDLFAVLLGGAVALLPVYARDILET